MTPSRPSGRALVVCESWSGNTRAVANVVADVLRRSFAIVDVVEPARAPAVVDQLDLLVVGAPTHVFGLSRPSTRRVAHRTDGRVVASGVREWLAELEPARRPLRVAVFDTRVRKPVIPGSAAHVVRRRLGALGFDVMPPISFSVHRTTGPLVDHEVDVAEEWAERIADEAGEWARTGARSNPAGDRPR